MSITLVTTLGKVKIEYVPVPYTLYCHMLQYISVLSCCNTTYICVIFLSRVFCDTVPNASFNFLALAAANYYDNTLFHRNMKGFMIQVVDQWLIGG